MRQLETFDFGTNIKSGSAQGGHMYLIGIILALAGMFLFMIAPFILKWKRKMFWAGVVAFVVGIVVASVAVA